MLTESNHCDHLSGLSHGRFGALTFIGMLATHAFTVGVGAQRTMATRSGHPLYEDFTWWLFNWAGEVNWVAAVLLFFSIPLLAVVGTVAIMAIDIPTQFFRTKTLDYLYGALLGLGVLAFTVVPIFRRQLLNEPAGETQQASLARVAN